MHSQSNRYSPHSDRLSGRGNRSIKSGSSFNHSSIGSSGDYTRKSEPCCKEGALNEPAKLEYFRDSGFSTQHSDDYNVFRYDFVDDGHGNAFCPLEFSTPEVPKAFQDDYVDEGSPMKYAQNRQPTNARSSAAAGFIGRTDMSTMKTTKIDNRNDLSPTEQELSPPLGTFKRQKCLRFKNRRSRCSSPSGRHCNYSERSDDRKPILRSKSDIGDRYWHRKEAKSMRSSPSGGGGDKDKHQAHKNEGFSELVQFFDQLGLSDQEYEEFIGIESPSSSPVFFSDSSTVDSNQLPDSTETQQTIQPYRPPETTSIVERNARIIKWLCNCKKLQMANK